MKLIVGLGNPGAEYIGTRHNLGFRVVSELAVRYKTKLKKKLFGKAKEAQIKFSGRNLKIIQPLTFMNRSGACVRGYTERLKLPLDDILIVCDDINLMTGQIRIRPQGVAGGHNGLESVIDSLGTKNFPRLRIGIKKDKVPDDFSEYVLSDFDEDQTKEIDKAIKKASDVCECWVKHGIEKAMNTYND